MAVVVHCLCGLTLKAPDHAAGHSVRCSHCGRPIFVPKNSESSEKEADAVIRTPCGHCGKVVKAPQLWAGLAGACPRCGKKVTIPWPEHMRPGEVAAAKESGGSGSYSRSEEDEKERETYREMASLLFEEASDPLPPVEASAPAAPAPMFEQEREDAYRAALSTAKGDPGDVILEEKNLPTDVLHAGGRRNAPPMVRLYRAQVSLLMAYRRVALVVVAVLLLVLALGFLGLRVSVASGAELGQYPVGPGGESVVSSGAASSGAVFFLPTPLPTQKRWSHQPLGEHVVPCNDCARAASDSVGTLLIPAAPAFAGRAVFSSCSFFSCLGGPQVTPCPSR